MKVVDIQKATAELSDLVRAIERGLEHEIVITRDGRPVAKLVPLTAMVGRKRIGVAKGKFEMPNTIDADSEELVRMFDGQPGAAPANS